MAIRRIWHNAVRHKFKQKVKKKKKKPKSLELFGLKCLERMMGVEPKYEWL